jgi:BASS family bile acid:Na+ symporter
MRVDLAALRNHLRRPGIVPAASAWTMIAAPALIGVGCLAAGVGTSSPDLFLALMLRAVASPMMAAPAPLFAYLFFGTALTLSLLGLSAKLAVTGRDER